MRSYVMRALIALLIGGHAAGIVWVISRETPREWLWRNVTGIFSILAAIAFAYIQAAHPYERFDRLLKFSLIISPGGVMLLFGVGMLMNDPATAFVMFRMAGLCVIAGVLLLGMHAFTGKHTNSA